MVGKIVMRLEAWRRARRIASLRAEFARHGRPLDAFDDAEVEEALSHAGHSLTDAELSAKPIFLMTRRLSSRKSAERLKKRAAAAVPQLVKQPSCPQMKGGKIWI